MPRHRSEGARPWSGKPHASVRRDQGARRLLTLHRARRVRRAARAIGLWQDDGASRLAGFERPTSDGSRRREDVVARPGTEARHGHGLSELFAVPQHERARQRGLRTAAASSAVRRAARAATNSWDSWDWGSTVDEVPAPALRRSTTARRPGARARYRAARPACSTSRSRRWTPRCAPNFAIRSARCSSAWPSRRSSSPTTRKRRSRWPTASASCRAAAPSRSPRRPSSTRGRPPSSSRSSSASRAAWASSAPATRWRCSVATSRSAVRHRQDATSLDALLRPEDVDVVVAPTGLGIITHKSFLGATTRLEVGIARRVGQGRRHQQCGRRLRTRHARRSRRERARRVRHRGAANDLTSGSQSRSSPTSSPSIFPASSHVRKASASLKPGCRSKR